MGAVCTIVKVRLNIEYNFQLLCACLDAAMSTYKIFIALLYHAREH